jgi:hypothetical protein
MVFQILHMNVLSGVLLPEPTCKAHAMATCLAFKIITDVEANVYRYVELLHVDVVLPFH